MFKLESLVHVQAYLKPGSSRCKTEISSCDMNVTPQVSRPGECTFKIIL